MENYNNITRIVIRKPVSLKNWHEALELLTVAKHELDAIQHTSEIMAIPSTVVDYQMGKIDRLINEAVQKAGFTNADDMKYFIEHFQKM